LTHSLILAAATFFARLENDNSREFWQANRSLYDQDIRPQFELIVNQIDGFTGWRVYRPHNDTRFQAEKVPYKTFIGAVAERPDGVGAFVQFSKRGLLVGTGLPMPASDQLTMLRSAIASDESGPQFLDAIAAVRAADATVHGGRWAPLKQVPKPFPRDHPRAEYLRWKGVEINTRLEQVTGQDATEAATGITLLIQRGEPLHTWLAAHVGPSAMTTEERFAPRRKGA